MCVCVGVQFNDGSDKVSTHQGLPPSPLCTLLKKYIRPYVLQQNKEYGTLRYISAPLLLIVADRLRGES